MVKNKDSLILFILFCFRVVHYYFVCKYINYFLYMQIIYIKNEIYDAIYDHGGRFSDLC